MKDTIGITINCLIEQKEKRKALEAKQYFEAQMCDMNSQLHSQKDIFDKPIDDLEKSL